MKLNEGGKQYKSKLNLWKAIKTTISEIKHAEVEKKLKSIDNWKLGFIEKDHYIKMKRIQRLICVCYS